MKSTKNIKFNINTLSEPLIGGLTKNNPTFRLVLGSCPTLAVTTSALNGLSMGLATTFVLICSNALISLLRHVIPSKVRIPTYILIIATFVTIVQMCMNTFLPTLYDSLGLFLPLIVVNCIILARAESFASNNSVLPSIADGLGVGLGFTISLTVLGLAREFLGTGSLFGYTIPGLDNVAMTIFVLPAGGFLIYALLMVAYNSIFDAIEKRKLDLAHKKAEDEMEDAIEKINASSDTEVASEGGDK